MSPPDTREGHEAVDQESKDIVQNWWKDNIGKMDEKAYTKAIIEDYSHVDVPDIMIVVDKLLTGFDEPKNTVLYIDKPLKEHNLIQAIARVNRLHSKKSLATSLTIAASSKNWILPLKSIKTSLSVPKAALTLKISKGSIAQWKPSIKSSHITQRRLGDI